MLEEQLLEEWLNLSRLIKNHRIVEDIPYNEAMVLSVLHSIYPNYLDVKVIVEKTKLLKSQVNRTMNALILKGQIQKRVKTNDKRCQEACLSKEGFLVISKTHQNSLAVSRKVISIIGEKNAEKIIEIFQMVEKNF